MINKVTNDMGPPLRR